MRHEAWPVVLCVVMSGCAGSAPANQLFSKPDGLVVDAPILELGTSFTFRTEGLYEMDDHVTSVVARSSSSGSLLASTSRDQLVTEIVWDLFWLGEMDTELNPERREAAGHVPLFEFPLFHGRTWAWGEQTVTAHQERVPGPGGSAEGFRMTVETESWTRTWTYSPQVGFLTSYRLEEGDKMYYAAELVAVGRASTWTWFQEIERWRPVQLASGVPITTVAFSPGSADAIAIAAGGQGGGRVIVQPPATSNDGPWHFHVSGEEDWAGALFAAEPGHWTITGAAPAEGFGYAEAVAVRWVTSEKSWMLESESARQTPS